MFVYKSQYVKSIEVCCEVSIVSSNQIRSHLGYLLFVNVPARLPAPSTPAFAERPSLVVTLGHGGWDRAGQAFATIVQGSLARRVLMETGACWPGPAECWLGDRLSRGPAAGLGSWVVRPG